MRVRKGEEGNGRDQETYFQAIRNLHEPSFLVPSDPDTKQPKGHSHSESRAPGLQNTVDDHRHVESRGYGAKESRPPKLMPTKKQPVTQPFPSVT
jgi:hypothetical protein